MGGLHVQAVKTFLDSNTIRNIYLLFDNDKAGKSKAEAFKKELQDKYKVKTAFPERAKDWNEELQDKQKQ